MFVICINNRGIENYLTIDKIYDIDTTYLDRDEMANWYRIKNDKGHITEYDKSRFTKPGTRTWRDRQLNKILK